MIINKWPYGTEPKTFQCPNCDGNFTLSPVEYLIQTKESESNGIITQTTKSFCNCHFCGALCTLTENKLISTDPPYPVDNN